MKKLLIIIILLLSICGCTSTETAEIKQVTCSEKDEILKNDRAMLIDVRTKMEYEEKHLDNAVNIPYEKIVETLDAYGDIDFNVPIVVYCQSGGRSSMAAESLKEAGYKNIYDLGAISNCDN